jgi:hypothetical protein
MGHNRLWSASANVQDLDSLEPCGMISSAPESSPAPTLATLRAESAAVPVRPFRA